MSGVAMKPCACTHAYQDAQYGVGVRVMNVGGSRDSPKFTCTVCGKQPTMSAKPKKTTK